MSAKSKADLIPKWGESSVLPSTIVDGRGKSGVSFLDALKGTHLTEENSICVSKGVIANNSKWLSNGLVGVVIGE